MSLLEEHRLTLKAAACEMRVDVHTVRRYVLRGVRDRRTGTITRLEHFRLGGRLFTTREALQRFIAAATAAGEPGAPLAVVPIIPPDQTPGQREVRP